jgi:hypothetical protein
MGASPLSDGRQIEHMMALHAQGKEQMPKAFDRLRFEKFGREIDGETGMEIDQVARDGSTVK